LLLWKEKLLLFLPCRLRRWRGTTGENTVQMN
jgi:hypothetical protein